VSIYSRDNPQLLFSMSGFEVQILPKIQTMGGEQYFLKDAGMLFRISQINKRRSRRRRHSFAFRMKVLYSHCMCICRCVLTVCAGVQQFNNCIRQVLMSSGSTTFSKIVNKWNAALIGLMTCYCEAVIHSNKLLIIFPIPGFRLQSRTPLPQHKNYHLRVCHQSHHGFDAIAWQCHAHTPSGTPSFLPWFTTHSTRYSCASEATNAASFHLFTACFLHYADTCPAPASCPVHRTHQYIADFTFHSVRHGMWGVFRSRENFET
jgi:U5-snRNA binding site 2 of PrP8